MSTWITCQIGARENFAIARALGRQGALRLVVTDAWVAPGNPLRPRLGRVGERSHPELTGKVWAPTGRAILRELADKQAKRGGWQQILHRNAWFQRMAIRRLSRIKDTDITVFAYSYAAAEIFAYAKTRGWRCVLGQIDPGPVEARMVDALYAEAGQPCEPIPAQYWDTWRQEITLADTIVVNSDWSRQGLLQEGASDDKITILPLAIETDLTPAPWTAPIRFDPQRPLRLLFLGQVTLRKGIDLALDAMRLLPDMPVQLDVTGPLQIDVPDWAKQDPRIRFHGGIPRSAVAEAYAQADLFVFPTRSDGFGLTQLEAQAAGVPLIASKRCGAVVQDGVNGRLLDPLDAGALVDILRDLAQNPDKLTALRQQSGPDMRFGLDRLGASLAALAQPQQEAAACPT